MKKLVELNIPTPPTMIEINEDILLSYSL